MSDFNGRTSPTPKKVQSQFFDAKNAFLEHNGHKPVFWCFAFHV